MTYRGRIENGVVVFDGTPSLPEGAAVTVCVHDFVSDELIEDNEGPPLYERLAPVVGVAEGLPADASRNVDHYLYGAPRQE